MELAAAQAPPLRKVHRQKEKDTVAKRLEQMEADQAKATAKKAAKAQKIQQAMQDMRPHRGPCHSVAELDALPGVYTKVGDLRRGLKAEVLYNKLVLGKESSLLRVGGTPLEIFNRLRQVQGGVALGSLPGFVAPAPGRQARQARQARQRGRGQQPVGGAADDEQAPATFTRNFKFQTVGEIVAVYYVQDYWVGQVISITDEDTADIDFFTTAGTCNGRRAFQWPRSAKIEEDVPACCVFDAKLVMTPVSAGGRAYQPEGSDLKASYEAFRAHLTEADNAVN